ncbi:MAG: hypothetical protein IKV26_05060 [Paludibacteraceae bacterium]|nr:hypothetical protein [Paludibacteraceae bacterium]
MDLATNGTGVAVWKYRRKVYSMRDVKEEYAMIPQNDSNDDAHGASLLSEKGFGYSVFHGR